MYRLQSCLNHGHCLKIEMRYRSGDVVLVNNKIRLLLLTTATIILFIIMYK